MPRFQLHRCPLRPPSSASAVLRATALVLVAVVLSAAQNAHASGQSRLVETKPSTSGSSHAPTEPPGRIIRASVPDANLYKDSATILPRTPAPLAEERTHGSAKSNAHKAPASSAKEMPSHRAQRSAHDASDSVNSTLFASATIHKDASDRVHRATPPNTPSEAYLPMLPEDFYAPSHVRQDPVAAEVGVPDMEPAHNGTGGFEYLTRRPLTHSKAMAGVVSPYPMTNVFSTWGDCRPGGRTHKGLDVGGVGENGGLGTPVYAMARAKITYIGLPSEDAQKFGKPEGGKGYVHRGPNATKLPRAEKIPGYGLVHFFTRTYGSWRTGTILVMKAMDGPLDGHQIRYMHLGAIQPNLHVGDIVEAGQEVGLMGGTAVLHDMPHMHIDIEDHNGKRVDVAPYVGLPADHSRCKR